MAFFLRTLQAGCNSLCQAKTDELFLFLEFHSQDKVKQQFFKIAWEYENYAWYMPWIYEFLVFFVCVDGSNSVATVDDDNDTIEWFEDAAIAGVLVIFIRNKYWNTTDLWLVQFRVRWIMQQNNKMESHT